MKILPYDSTASQRFGFDNFENIDDLMLQIDRIIVAVQFLRDRNALASPWDSVIKISPELLGDTQIQALKSPKAQEYKEFSKSVCDKYKIELLANQPEREITFTYPLVEWGTENEIKITVHHYIM